MRVYRTFFCYPPPSLRLWSFVQEDLVTTCLELILGIVETLLNVELCALLLVRRVLPSRATTGLSLFRHNFDFKTVAIQVQMRCLVFLRYKNLGAGCHRLRRARSYTEICNVWIYSVIYK